MKVDKTTQNLALLEDFTALKEEVEKARQNASEAKGARAHILEILKRDFGCSSLREARNMLGGLEKSNAAQTQQLTLAIEKYRRTWRR